MAVLKSILKKIIPQGDLRGFLSIIHHIPEYRRAGISVKKDGRNLELKFDADPIRDITFRYPWSLENFNPDAMCCREIIGYLQDMPSVEQSGVVFDCGAFPGEFPQFLNQRYPQQKRVICLEPDPKNRQYLDNVRQLSGISNMEILSYALSDCNGYSKMRMCGASSSIVMNGNANPKDIEVKTITLDQLLFDLDIDARKTNVMVKMDIEGAELLALDGAKDTVRKGAFFAIASYHQLNGEQTHIKLRRLFEQEGYETRLVYPSHLTLLAKPKK